MASDTEQTGGDSGLSKAVWHYMGVGVLGIGLLLMGLVAFERPIPTMSYLTSLLPGEVNTLKAEIAEYESMNQNLTHGRDQTVKTSDTRGLALRSSDEWSKSLRRKLIHEKRRPPQRPRPERHNQTDSVRAALAVRDGKIVGRLGPL